MRHGPTFTTTGRSTASRDALVGKTPVFRSGIVTASLVVAGDDLSWLSRRASRSRALLLR
jgi:hypothetical protein